MAPPPKYVIQTVTQVEIRCIFDKGRYFERFQEGEFFPRVKRVGASPLGAPGGGYSQIVRYLEMPNCERTVVIVHQRAGDDYGNPRGGDKPDPKRIVRDGVDYRYSPFAVPSLGCGADG